MIAIGGGSAAAAEWHDWDWLHRFKPDPVAITCLTESHTLLVVAGPSARSLLEAVSPHSDWSNAGFPWLHGREMYIAHAKVMVMRLSFSGELAYELHIPNAFLNLVWETLTAAGRAFQLGYFGLYAAESMRLEKGYLHWKADLIYEFNPYEAGLNRFVSLDKGDFLGKEALLEQRQRGLRKQLVALAVDCPMAPAHAGDPVFAESMLIGAVTSAGFGHRLQKNIALAYIDPKHAQIGSSVSLQILGDRYPAVVVPAAQYDPSNARMRA